MFPDALPTRFESTSASRTCSLSGPALYTSDARTEHHDRFMVQKGMNEIWMFSTNQLSNTNGCCVVCDSRIHSDTATFVPNVDARRAMSKSDNKDTDICFFCLQKLSNHSSGRLPLALHMFQLVSKSFHLCFMCLLFSAWSSSRTDIISLYDLLDCALRMTKDRVM